MATENLDNLPDPVALTITKLIKGTFEHIAAITANLEACEI